MRTAPGGVCRSSLTWSHVKLVRSTQLYVKSWLGSIPLGRGNPDFHSDIRSAVPVYTASTVKINTFPSYEGNETKIKQIFQQNWVYLMTITDMVFSKIRKNLIKRHNCHRPRQWRESRLKADLGLETNKVLGLKIEREWKSKKVEFGDTIRNWVKRQSFTLCRLTGLSLRSGIWRSIYCSTYWNKEFYRASQAISTRNWL